MVIKVIKCENHLDLFNHFEVQALVILIYSSLIYLVNNF